MRRSWGGRLMPALLSKAVRPLTRTKPLSGRRMPAVAWSVRLFPAPDGPNRTAIASAALKAVARWNAPRRLRMSTSSTALPARDAQQPADNQQAEQGGDGQDGHQGVGQSGVAGLPGIVDGDGHRSRLAGDVAGEHDRGAELADGTSEGQGGAGDNAGPGQGQSNSEEQRQAQAERVFEELAQQAPPSEHLQQVVTQDSRGQYQGKGHQCRKHASSPELTSCQEPGQPHPQHQADGGRQGGHL